MYRSSPENNYSGAADFRAVQIFKPDVGGRYKLDRVALEIILSQDGVADKPVAVYSLAGAFRHGKSFMLNFFMRFLQHGRSEQWMRNKTDLLNKGFGWRGGRDRCTQGIWMWNEPFTVSTDDGEIVVFLVDTQGTFDYESSMEGCSLIFALSTLISSFQIFNIMRQIQESDLQHLQLFTEYGKLAKSSGQQLGKAFQGLMFLVRDWHDPAFIGFEGGKVILDDVLRLRASHKDLKSVRRNINHSFENVSCVLMPHPGKAVAFRAADSPPLTLADVDSEFLIEVNSLVRYLFIDNIAVKRVNGNVVTGTDLINFTIAYCEVFESGNMPEIGTIMEASAKAAILTTVQKCKDEYIDKMAQICNCEKGYVDEGLLRDLHQQLKDETLRNFDRLPKMGDRGFIAQYRKYLSTLVDQQSDTFVQINLTQKEQMKNKIRDHVADAEATFSSTLEKMCDQSYVHESNLREMEEESRSVVMKSFRGATKSYDQRFVAVYEARLNDLLYQAFERFKEINKLRKGEFNRELSQMSLKALETYSNAMDEKCEGRFVEFASFNVAHKQATQMAFTEFDSCAFGNGTTEKRAKRSELVTDILQTMEKYKGTNEINKKLDEAKTLETLTKAKDLYRSLMKEDCGDGYCTESQIDRAHDHCKSQALAIIYSVEAEKGKEFADKCRSQLDTVLEDALVKLKNQNSNLKTAESNKFKQKAFAALDVYRNGMETFRDNYIEKKQLENGNQTFKNQALQTYGMSIMEPVDDYRLILEELKRDLQTQYEFAQSRNADNKQRLEARAEQVINELKTGYIVHMDQVCSARYVEPGPLRKQHDNLKGQLKGRFENNFSMLPDKLVKLDMELDGLFERVKSVNQNNKPNVLRKVGSALLDGLQGAAAGFALPLPPNLKLPAAAIGGVFNVLVGLFK